MIVSTEDLEKTMRLFVDTECLIHGRCKTLTTMTIEAGLATLEGRMSVQEFKERFKTAFTREQLKSLKLTGLHILLYESVFALLEDALNAVV